MHCRYGRTRKPHNGNANDAPTGPGDHHRDGRHAESLTSAATSAVTNANDAPTGLPTITGTPTQGETLTAVTDAIRIQMDWEQVASATSGKPATPTSAAPPMKRPLF